MKPKSPTVHITEPDGNQGVTAAFVDVVVAVVELLFSATAT